VNLLDNVLQSYPHQGNPKLDQIKYITETHDDEFVDLEVVILLSKVYAFCEGHITMDCPFLLLHIKVNIAGHVES